MSVGLVSALLLGGCSDDIDPVIEKLDFNRPFSPVELTAKVRNRTTVELNWTVKSNVDKYVIEIAEDELVFGNIIKTIEVTKDEVPYSVVLMGETTYSARVKSVITGKGDSKWSSVSFKTDSENIFNAVAAEDVKSTSVRLTWPAGSDVTHLVITPGDIRHDLTEGEIAEGAATVEGLTGETSYEASIYRNDRKRGTITFRTTVDLGDAIAVYPEDDLKAILEGANAGDVFALFPGDYAVSQGKINITQSIGIKGVRPDNRPVLHNQFVLGENVSIEIRDIIAIGDGKDEGGVSTTDHFIQIATSGVTAIGNILVDGCKISGYSKSLLAAGSGTFSVNSVEFNNCVVSDILTSGADFIDFRSSAVAKLTLSNSTFYNCAVAREFIRMDNASAFADVNPAIIIDHCTLYKVSVGSTKGVLYVRKAGNTSSIANTIIASTNTFYSTQSATTQPECDKNNYFEADDFLPTSVVAKVLTDQSGNFTILNPGFANPDNGDFKVSDQTVIDNGTGDPRWLQ